MTEAVVLVMHYMLVMMHTYQYGSTAIPRAIFDQCFGYQEHRALLDLSIRQSSRVCATYSCSRICAAGLRVVPRLKSMVRLECKSPVPSDIDIAQAATPVHISEIAKAAGLSPEEYDLYGTTKAKVGVERLSKHCVI